LEPLTKDFNEKALKPAAKVVGENAEEYAEKFNKEMTKAAGVVGDNAAPVTEKATDDYLRPAAEVSQIWTLHPFYVILPPLAAAATSPCCSQLFHTFCISLYAGAPKQPGRGRDGIASWTGGCSSFACTHIFQCIYQRWLSF